MSTTIYDLLTGVKIDDLKVTDLDSATGRTFVDTQTIEFWQGILTLSHVLKGARTYPHGLPLPETGDVHIETIANGASATVGPTGTEIWVVENINLNNCTVGFIDTAGDVSPIDAGGTGIGQYSRFYITSTLKLAFSNASGSEQTPSIAYLKVSL
jgi:hypothetical protein